MLLHLIKHRGYLSQRKNESKSENKELGALLSGVASNHELLQQATYRTPAELAVKNLRSKKVISVTSKAPILTRLAD